MPILTDEKNSNTPIWLFFNFSLLFNINLISAHIMDKGDCRVNFNKTETKEHKIHLEVNIRFFSNRQVTFQYSKH